MNSLGINQTWKNVTSSRKVNTTYTNASNKPIAISINCTRGTDFEVNLYVNDAIVSRIFKSHEGYWKVNLQAVIPPKATYKFTNSGNSTMESWLELS